MKNYVLFNHLAGNGKGEEKAQNLEISGDTQYLNLTKIDYNNFFENIEKQDRIIICGGDGTLSKFINNTSNIKFSNPVFYAAAGSGNDFLNDLDLKPSKKPIDITEYIKDLPSVNVKGKDIYFINGIGYGIDGYCCEERDKKQQKNNKSVNYTLIALKGLLFKFKPKVAKVVVDGQEYNYKRVWLCPTMNGRFFGGGMMIAPMQDRKNGEKLVTLIVAHSLSKLKIVCLFPTIFKGKHIKFTKNVTIHKGHKITVKFDSPSALQIDGETVLDVSEYTVTSSKLLQTQEAI